MRHVALLLFILLLNVACHSRKKYPNAEQEKLPEKKELSLSEREEIYYYKGLIGSKLNVDVVIHKQGELLSGNYRYYYQSSSLTLKGLINGDQYVLTEYDPKGNATGTFSGKINDETHEVKGTWSSASTSATLPFTFIEKGVVTDTSGDVVVGKRVVQGIELPVVLDRLDRDKLNAINTLFEYENVTGRELNHRKEDYGSSLDVGTIDVVYNANMILCVEWLGETTSHVPDGYYTYFNIDLQTGKELKLSYLLNEQGQEYVRAQVEKEINARLKQVLTDTTNTPPEEVKEWCTPHEVKMGDVQEFSITDKSLVIHYNKIRFPYLLRTYAPLGEVWIPYNELKDMFTQSSVLKRIR